MCAVSIGGQDSSCTTIPTEFDRFGKVNLRLETIATSGDAQPTLEVLAATLQPCIIMGLLGLEVRVGITKCVKLYVGLKCMKRGRIRCENMTIGKMVFIKSLINKRSIKCLGIKNNRVAGGCIGVMMRICQYTC